MNINALKKIKTAILREPKRINMDTGISHADQYDLPACGTVGCIAGWGLHLKAIEETTGVSRLTVRDIRAVSDKLSHAWWHDIEPLARMYLGISPRQADRLFHVEHWPQDLQDEISEFDSGTSEYARVVAKAIDRFIADPDKFVEGSL